MDHIIWAVFLRVWFVSSRFRVGVCGFPLMRQERRFATDSEMARSGRHFLSVHRQRHGILCAQSLIGRRMVHSFRFAINDFQRSSAPKAMRSHRQPTKFDYFCLFLVSALFLRSHLIIHNMTRHRKCGPFPCLSDARFFLSTSFSTTSYLACASFLL